MTLSPEKRRPPQTAPLRASSFEDVEVELAHLVFRGLASTVLTSMAGIFGAAGLVAFRFHDGYLGLLTFIAIVLCCIRLALPLAFPGRAARGLSAQAARRWQTAYGLATLLYCCVVAAATVHECHVFHTVGTSVCTIGNFCLCIGLSSRAGLRPLLVQACGLILLSNLAFAIWRNGDNLYGVSLMLILFFSSQFCHSIHSQFHGLVEQLRSRRQLRVLAEQDALTGLANRRHFEASLTQLCAAATPFAILFIDLDRFKHVNDTHGHATGDALLIEVAARLRAAVRGSDLLARLGGDEFAILQTPLVDAGSPSALATRINDDIATPFLLHGHHIRIGASVGIRLATTTPADPDALLCHADQALYAVKQSGGGSFALARA